MKLRGKKLLCKTKWSSLFLNQVAFWDLSVIPASRRLFQHGQHLEDVSGIVPVKDHTLLINCFCSHSPVVFQKLCFRKRGWQEGPVIKHPPEQMTSSLFSITAGSSSQLGALMCSLNMGMLPPPPQWGLHISLGIPARRLQRGVDSFRLPEGPKSLCRGKIYTWALIPCRWVQVMHEGRRRFSKPQAESDSLTSIQTNW